MTYPVFATGDVLPASDMNAIGMWRINNCTVTSTGGTAATASNGVITVGTNNTRVDVLNAFSSSYTHYRVTYSGGTASGLILVTVQLGSTAANYYGSRSATSVAGAAALVGDNNAASWQYAGIGNTTWMMLDFELFNPQAARRTFIHAKYWEGTGALGTYTGYQDSNTVFTGFSLVPQSGNISGGTIRVYGYNL